MSAYAVITQNDESNWDDIKGDLYHYPNTYKTILTRGCKVVYYKGRMKNPVFAPSRLSPTPHYFGIGIIGDSIIDPNSSKEDRYCEILEYQEFEEAVLAKADGEYLETIPESKKLNYWRFGVRAITKSTYDLIVARANIRGYQIALPSALEEFESFQPTEGRKKVRYSAYYERNPFYRTKAIEEHGVTCMACEFNFEAAYGEHGRGYIHVHHNKPLNETGPTKINPKTDMSVLCANCHSMIHRRKERTLSIDEVVRLMKKDAR